MQVRNHDLGHVAGAYTNRATETDTRGGQVDGRNQLSSSDRVEVSTLASKVAQAGENLDASRASKIAEIAASLKAGTYKTDPHAISQKMVSDWISSATPSESF